MIVFDLPRSLDETDSLFPNTPSCSCRDSDSLNPQEKLFISEHGDDLEADCIHPQDQVLIVRNGVDDIIGMQSFSYISDHNAAFINTTIVHQDHRLQGIGTKLVQSALDHIARQSKASNPLIFLSPGVTQTGKAFRKALLNIVNDV